MNDTNSLPMCRLASDRTNGDFYALSYEKEFNSRGRPVNAHANASKLVPEVLYEMMRLPPPAQHQQFSPSADPVRNHHNHQMRNAAATGEFALRYGTLPYGPPQPDNGERYSRKVFVGGLPPDIDEDEIVLSFRQFGPLAVDWPHKQEMKSRYPPKGYAFLLYQEESSVHRMIESCIEEDNKLYFLVSSPTIRGKPVQIRPWKLSDADLVLDESMSLDPRKTVFIGGVPRPLKAIELATIMNRLYGGVCYAGIDTDPELKYPKGAGRVSFSNLHSYIAAISTRFVQLQHGDIDKRVEVKPYVIDDQVCDECQGQQCGELPKEGEPRM
ncbi:RNA recognition motif. (a.k.a. RRM, RBD, or RNP domain) [Nesidiocoris tenuis]|uniref:RNA recognition motif. (A.k.a. RRM, RBD, or RNP domain) n=1 Tax=Nesidiocoris tenuis TaxID=355587 RepID=A0ABN7AJV6_9HEMI|nr:RNA recognition motif. (a.k.a. RRM, RBD, or RNP domain) [Nesidiocoris tenuis]